jgi:DNA mismatch repair protein MutS2
LFVPARRASLPWASGLFVSLIEQAHVDQREGRLGTELLRIRHLFEQLEPGSLVILDELCSGTNPSEGEEIFRLVVNLLGEVRPAAFITTHFLSFAARLAAEKPSLEFLQVELDGEERPTYGFVRGVATTSLAHRTAARLGVTEAELRRLALQKSPTKPKVKMDASPSSGARSLRAS